ncbi:MAG: DUF87 domain-containing protein [Candidatus Nanoarchaeia archaeon]|jgi:hypothetical protein
MIVVGVKGEGVDESDLLTSRSCIIAQSGAGKSYGVAVICEQLAANNLGFCIIDTEGEYFSLKQKFDVLWVGGKEADVELSSIDLPKLAERVITEGVPLIFDVSDVTDDKKLVDDWLTALYEAASRIRRPYLLVIEEADKYIPQRGEGLSIIQEVARRGRKRGLGLMVASQRPALVNKGVLSQCNHQFIGKLTVENDLDAVKHFFDSRKNVHALTDLLPGEFFMVGFKPEETLFKFRQRETTHESITPKIKERLPVRLKELITSINTKNNGSGVKSLINKSDAELIALNNCRRKYLLIGEREKVLSVKLIYKPLIELTLKVIRKTFFNNEQLNITAYITPELLVVDNYFKKKFDLFSIKNLSSDDVRALIAILYNNARTISDVMSFTHLPERDSRKLMKKLEVDGLIMHYDWRGKQKLFKPTTKLSIPKTISLASETIETSVDVNNDYSPDETLLSHVIKSLDPKTSIVNTKVIYYPFYKAILERGEVNRELFINGVNGRVE